MGEIRTARLKLRRITHDDIPAIVAGLNDYEVSKWLTVVPFPYGFFRMQEVFARSLARRNGKVRGLGRKILEGLPSSAGLFSATPATSAPLTAVVPILAASSLDMSWTLTPNQPLGPVAETGSGDAAALALSTNSCIALLVPGPNAPSIEPR